jgi:hypothetical protein
MTKPPQTNVVHCPPFDVTLGVLLAKIMYATRLVPVLYGLTTLTRILRCKTPTAVTTYDRLMLTGYELYEELDQIRLSVNVEL